MDIKKPPDKYRIKKISLKKIIKDGNDYSDLHSAILRTHKLTILVYQLLRAYILYQYSNNLEIPIIDTSFIIMVYKIFLIESRGPKPKDQNLDTFNKLKQFYELEFKNLTDGERINGKNLSDIIGYSAIDILTNIENNIKCNFFKYINKFVNESFREANNLILESLKGKEKIGKRKEINKEMWILKEDLKNNTKESDVKYHEWLLDVRNQILPINIKDHECEINVNPQKYLIYMIRMNKLLEDKKLKQFQFFPLRTDCVPKYIQLGTKSLIELLIEENKNEYLSNIGGYKEKIWQACFKLEHKIFRMNNYSFDYGISTDGFAVSIRFIHDDFLEAENIKKKKIQISIKETKEMNKGKTKVEKQKMRDEKKEKQKIKQKEFEKKKKELKAKTKGEKTGGTVIKKSYIEFPYFDKLSIEETKVLKNSELVYVDPGKRSLLYMYGDNGKFLNYTNKRRVSEIKRLKYQEQRENHKKEELSNSENDTEKEKSVIEIESELSGYNSKSCSYEQFKEYVKKKNAINVKLFKFYEEDFFRKLNWFGYINTQRSEDNLLNLIEETFGKDIIIIYGDWNQSGKIKYMSTPGISLKRKISERFKIYNIDEFRTSCLNYKTEERCENLYLRTGKDKVLRKMHAILTYKMENQREGCINRDKNSVLNMKKLVSHYIEKGERLYKYRRGVDLDKTEN